MACVMRRVASRSAAVALRWQLQTSAGRSLSSASQATTAEAPTATELTPDEIKARTAKAWSFSAKGYAHTHMYDASDARPPAAQLHRVAAQLCAGVIARRCEGVDGPGRPCKQRATHGPPHGEATLCADHVDAWDARIADIKGDGPPSVLDVASAAGEPAVSIARMLPQATVHATDYSPGMVEALNARIAALRQTEGLANVHTGVADGEVSGIGAA
eukprot:TRINITY_DN228_c1_g3_i1.p1 TRINITY_DN228_c1_g3~~TRINITY_DN228_c1_g3_i1.p1  ORF type:complete len:230 (-),score=48.85 TRINITY_DN228_c1_g3_i1:1281-1928(-)